MLDISAHPDWLPFVDQQFNVYISIFDRIQKIMPQPQQPSNACDLLNEISNRFKELGQTNAKLLKAAKTKIEDLTSQLNSSHLKIVELSSKQFTVNLKNDLMQ